jgi:hypothetical protein
MSGARAFIVAAFVKKTELIVTVIKEEKLICRE